MTTDPTPDPVELHEADGEQIPPSEAEVSQDPTPVEED